MTFGEYKTNGGTWDYKVWANDTNAGFGKKGDTIYGYSPAMEDWEIEAVTTSIAGVVDGKPVYRTTLHIVYPWA